MFRLELGMAAVYGVAATSPAEHHLFLAQVYSQDIVIEGRRARWVWRKGGDAGLTAGRAVLRGASRGWRCGPTAAAYIGLPTKKRARISTGTLCTLCARSDTVLSVAGYRHIV